MNLSPLVILEPFVIPSLVTHLQLELFSSNSLHLCIRSYLKISNEQYASTWIYLIPCRHLLVGGATKRLLLAGPFYPSFLPSNLTIYNVARIQAFIGMGAKFPYEGASHTNLLVPRTQLVCHWLPTQASGKVYPQHKVSFIKIYVIHVYNLFVGCVALVHCSISGLSSPYAQFITRLSDQFLPLEFYDSNHHMLK